MEAHNTHNGRKVADHDRQSSADDTIGGIWLFHRVVHPQRLLGTTCTILWRIWRKLIQIKIGMLSQPLPRLDSSSSSLNKLWSRFTWTKGASLNGDLIIALKVAFTDLGTNLDPRSARFDLETANWRGQLIYGVCTVQGAYVSRSAYLPNLVSQWLI